MDTTPHISQKRFVAGAKCPQCNELDSTVSYEITEPSGKLYVRECVECDFKETLSDADLEEASSQEESGDQVPIVFKL